jgi:hypothetical protein
MTDSPQTVFTYQRHLRPNERNVWLFFGAIIVLCNLVPLAFQSFYFSSFAFPMRLMMMFSCTLLFLAVFVIQVGREMSNTRYIVDALMLKRVSPWSTTGIHFENITELSYRRRWGVVRIGAIRSKTLTIRLPFVIENLAALVNAIEQRLIACGNQGCFDAGEITTFKRDALVSDLRTRRTFRFLPTLTRLCLSLVALNSFVAVYIWRLPWIFALGWMSFGVIFPLAGHLAADYTLSSITRRHLIHSPDTLPVLDVKKTYGRIAVILGVLYLAAGIFYRTIYAWWRPL